MTTWTCEKCGQAMDSSQIAAHAAWHDRQRDLADAGLRADGIGPPIDQTRPPPPIVPPEASLPHRLAALATWLEEFPFQPACVTGAKTASEAARRIEELTAEANALGERVDYYYELYRRLERYAAFDADGYVAVDGVGCISVCCRNCGHCFPQSRAHYEQLQRETHERNGRVDL